jgi:hypothetical protein
MANIKYIYNLTRAEITELENINWNDITESVKWINNKLQEAFDTGRKHPIETE